jgi:hypothetical protein
MTSNIHRVGAVFYVAWGVLHIVGGAALTLTAATGDPAGALEALGSARLAAAIPGDPGSVVAGVVAFHGWNILWSGALVTFVAARWTWRNTSLGAWLPFSLVAIADLGLLLFLLVPGEMSWADGIWGPLLFVPAAVATAIGRRRVATPARPPSADERLVGFA